MTRLPQLTHRTRSGLAWLLAAAILLLAVPDAAFSQVERKGFIIGFGLGAGQVKTSASEGSFTVSVSQTAVTTDFKIGYAPSDQLLIYWSADGAFRGQPKEAKDLGADGILYTGLGGLGGTYFLSTDENSFFLTASIGFATDGVISSDRGSDSVSGKGLAIGGGYEFSRHWVVDADAIFNSLSDSGLDYNTRTIRLGVSWLHY